MFDFVTTKLLMWVCGGLLAALLITGAFAGCEHHNAAAARADRDAMESQRDAARSARDQVVKANESQHATIEQQSQALDEWAKLGVTLAEVRKMVADVAAKRAELDALIAANARQKEKDDANPDCEKLRRVDFQRVCPNRAGVLRGYENRLPRQGRASTDAGIRVAPQ